MCSPAIFRLKEPEIYWFGGGYISWIKGGALSPNINRKLGSEITIENNSFITGCAMFLKREMLLKVGGFSPDYFMYAEDIDYCQRVLDSGYQIGYLHTTKIFHDAHASIIKDRSSFIAPEHWSNRSLSFSLTHMTYGLFLNLKKHSHGNTRLLGTLRLCLRYVRWCASYIIHGRIDGIKAIYKGIKHSIIGKIPQ
jgi:GT2 family glycosyltransferase